MTSTRTCKSWTHSDQAVQEHLRQEGHDVETLLAEIEEALTHSRQSERVHSNLNKRPCLPGPDRQDAYCCST